MRKSNIRKWFHLVIDFIPLFIIPVFIVYSGNKNGNFEQSITTAGYEVQNKYETNEVNSVDDLIEGNIYHFNNYASTTNYNLYVSIVFNLERVNNTIILELESNDDTLLHTDGDVITNGTNQIINMNGSSFDFVYDHYIGNIPSTVLERITTSDFNVLENVWNEGIVLNDTDIGSQFMYSLYTPIQKMFNFSELGGFKQFYQWISLNVFQGTAPIPFFIVFNVMIYNFLVDLIFLLYSVFMFFIDFAEHCMDNFMAKSQKGVK